MSFAQLKKASGNVADLSSKLKSATSSGGFEKDNRYWSLTVDKAGNGYAVIRFLPAPEGEESPAVLLYNHAFQGVGGKWYIENSRTTLGEPDPVSEANSELWNTGLEENKKIASNRKRKKQFIANILVISDPKAPENEGKVFLYKFGPKIMGKLEMALNPPAEFPDEKPFDPFDFWKGADFKLKARVVEKQRNYDSSSFEAPTPLFDGDDAALEKLWNAQYSLKAEIAPDKFKSYEDLKKRFEQVTGVGRGPSRPSVEDDMSAATRQEPRQAVATRSAPAETDEAPPFDAGDEGSRFAHLLAD